MTLDDIKKYFGSSYKFSQATGMAHTNFVNWHRKGFVPYLTQGKIERFTGGALVADYNHGEGKFKNVNS